MESHGTDRVGSGGRGVLELGTEPEAASPPMTAMGTLTRKTEPHQK